jgi:Ribbon-helix-helix protein, copG family
MYGMSHKTTVYLPDDLKLALEREALRRGCSEAEVIRDALGSVVNRPRPNAGLFSGESLSDRVDELLSDFGQR